MPPPRLGNVPVAGSPNHPIAAAPSVDGVIKKARRASTQPMGLQMGGESFSFKQKAETKERRRCSCQKMLPRRTSGCPAPGGAPATASVRADNDLDKAPADAALTSGMRRDRKGSVLLAGVYSMSEGSKLVVQNADPDVSLGRPLGSGVSSESNGASDEDEKKDEASFARRKMLAPFRRKSIIDRVLLGETERLTRNPVRYGLDALVIHPSNRLKAVFDGIVQVATLYSLSAVPLQFAFGALPHPVLSTECNSTMETSHACPCHRMHTAGAWPPFGVDALIDSIFMLDVVLHFFHGYVERGYPVLSLRQVSYRYLTSWFAIEAIASLPYDHLFTERSVALISLLRAFRLRRLGVAIANSRIGGNRSSGLVAFLRVVYILGVWVVFAHVFACIFFSLGWRLRCSGPTYQATWLDVLQFPTLDLPECPPADGIPPGDTTPYWDSMAAPVELLQGQEPGRPRWLDMWVLSLHWAISSMSSLGYGKGPSGITIAEFFFTIFCQITGACLYAAIFGNIAQLLAKLDAPSARFRAQRDKIDEFVSFHELPYELTKKLHAYCKFLFAVNHGFDVGQISGALPPNLQHELLLHLHAPLVKSVPMFAECDDAFIKAIVLQLRPQVLLGGDAAFKANEAGTEMYFIMRGEMRMMDESLTVCYNALYSGAYFGELAMLTGQPRTATALAVTDCVLFYINQADFNTVARKWPKALHTILAKAKERLERINNCNSKVLASQLGERLSAVRIDMESDGGGILGMMMGAGGGNLRKKSAMFLQPPPPPPPPAPPPPSSSVQPEASSNFLSRNSTFIRPTSTGSLPEWQGHIETSMQQCNNGLALVLQRLEEQSELMERLAGGKKPPNGFTATDDMSA